MTGFFPSSRVSSAWKWKAKHPERAKQFSCNAMTPEKTRIALKSIQYYRHFLWRRSHRCAEVYHTIGQKTCARHTCRQSQQPNDASRMPACARARVCVSVFCRWDSSVECTMRVAVTLSLRLRRWRIRQPHVERCQMRQSQTSLWWHGLAAATLIYAPRAFVCATPVTIMCSRRLVKASVVEWQSLKKQDKRIYSASRNKSNRSTK